MIEEFFEFLDQRNLVEAFEEYRDGVLDKLNPEMYVSSFCWHLSTEGYGFWQDINDDWQDYLGYWEEDLGKEWYLKGDYNETQI
jgi:hypothetical protein